ncbi:hypothetical protein SESBI_45227 [Sesbania bispinosa]|nr:hypothetical protein SESBI_45227 [Sesbania bispinosa]
MSPQRKGRASEEWWATCKVRRKLFLTETFNDEYDHLNEVDAGDYYQDDGSLEMPTVNAEDEVIFLFDTNSPMEEVDINDIYKPIDIPFVDELIDDNECGENDEVLDEDEDEELYNSDSSDS